MAGEDVLCRHRHDLKFPHAKISAWEFFFLLERLSIKWRDRRCTAKQMCHRYQILPQLFTPQHPFITRVIGNVAVLELVSDMTSFGEFVIILFYFLKKFFELFLAKRFIDPKSQV